MKEITMEDIRRADRYWEDREQDVWRAARENGLSQRLEALIKRTDFDMGSFLFELFDNGDADLKTVNISAELVELFNN